MQIETLDQQLKKLHHNVELLVINRKGTDYVQYSCIFESLKNVDESVARQKNYTWMSVLNMGVDSVCLG